MTIRFYALCILAGVVVAVWLAGRRLTARGGQPGVILDITMWAVPFGIVGGRQSECSHSLVSRSQFRFAVWLTKLIQNQAGRNGEIGSKMP